MAIEEIKVPDIGDYADVDVIEVHVQKGDKLKPEDPIISLETDKATMEVPAPKAGTVAEVVVQEGSKVSQGDLVLKLQLESDQDSANASSQAASEADNDKASADNKASASKSQSAPQQVKVPDIGDYQDVDVIEVHVSAGDTIAKEQPLISLETDKATMEVPSPIAGTVVEVKVNEGDKVSQGDLVLTCASADSSSDQVEEQPVADNNDQPAAAEQQSAPSKQEQEQPVSESAEGGLVDPAAVTAHAGPAVRRFARELGVDLSKVKASGRKSRLLKEDVQKHVKSIMQQGAGASTAGDLDLLADPVVDFAKFGEIEQQPLSRIKKLSGANLARNWVKIPHITLFEQADITDLESFRKAKKQAAEQAGAKLTPVPFLIKAAARALRDYPLLNSSLSADGQHLVMKKYVHVGFAVDTPNGLVVPVVRDADQKGLFEIAKDMAELVAKARAGKLKPDEMKGGCFTISSLGNVGTTGFTPIVNMPEVGILGVSKAAMHPVYDGAGSFMPRLMLPLSLSVDHRVVDGAQAGQFIVALANYLSDLRELLL